MKKKWFGFMLLAFFLTILFGQTTVGSHKICKQWVLMTFWVKNTGKVKLHGKDFLAPYKFRQDDDDEARITEYANFTREEPAWGLMMYGLSQARALISGRHFD